MKTDTWTEVPLEKPMAVVAGVPYEISVEWTSLVDGSMSARANVEKVR